MGKPKRQSFTHEQRLKAFVLRARRITAHSLWREQKQLLEKLHAGQMNVSVTLNHLTGEVTYIHREEFPEEELLESLAARIRPLILDSEELHYSKVLGSIAALVPAADFPNYILPIEDWHELWATVATRDESAQAYYIVTDRGAASDQDLMYAWLYGDVVHADDKEVESKGLSIEQRYKAAAGIVTRIVDRTELTLLLIRMLVDEGVLTVDSELFEREVVVRRTIFSNPVQAYAAVDPNTPLPLDGGPLDPEIWMPMYKTVAAAVPSASSCVVWWKSRGRPYPATPTFPQQRVILQDMDPRDGQVP
ncbi:hypothetical protein IFM12275_69020 (plasmid) [Nocardia sputorum]|uniref:hypothetical protein n=1 Tax=Nocardia sputorum TaxID=2984338 RepID=UPI0024928916|nr:hypothetical protein [Nocardia sputorum]BDT96926.1 hypothetical protein IFM12275_69020 [Nocardia sputorum]